MVDIVVAAAEVEVEHVDGVDLLDLVVVLPYLQLFDDGLGRAKENALHEMLLAGQLYLDNDYLAAGNSCLYVHAV